MTGPTEDSPEPTGPPETGPPDTVTAPPERPARPGVGIFTIEGRAAPGLFVVGWVASVLGGGLVLGGVTGPSTAILVVGLAVLSAGLIAAAGGQAIERVRGAEQPLERPSDRVRGGLMTGQEDRDQLVAQLPVGERRARFVAPSG